MSRQNVEKQVARAEMTNYHSHSAHIVVDPRLMSNETQIAVSRMQAGGVMDTSLCVLNYASGNEL